VQVVVLTIESLSILLTQISGVCIQATPNAVFFIEGIASCRHCNDAEYENAARTYPLKRHHV